MDNKVTKNCSSSTDDLSELYSDESVSSLKSLDYAKIDEILNEDKKPAQDNTPWWLRNVDKKEIPAKKSTWLKRHAGQMEKVESAKSPEKDHQTPSVHNSVSASSVQEDKSLRSTEDVASEKSIEKTSELSSISSNTGDGYSENFDEDMSESTSDDETDRNSHIVSESYASSEVKPHAMKEKHVTFVEQDEIIDHDPPPKRTVVENIKPGLSRIAANFNPSDVKTQKRTVDAATSACDDTLARSLKQMEEKLKTQEAEHQQEFERERVRHLQEMSDLQEMIQAISNQVQDEKKALDVDGSEKDKLTKEIEEQKMVLRGYEAENKRLISEVKKKDEKLKNVAESKDAEKEDLLKDNFRLREQLEQKQSEIKFLKTENDQLILKVKQSSRSVDDASSSCPESKQIDVAEMNKNMEKLWKENTELQSKLASYSLLQNLMKQLMKHSQNLISKFHSSERKSTHVKPSRPLPYIQQVKDFADQIKKIEMTFGGKTAEWAQDKHNQSESAMVTNYAQLLESQVEKLSLDLQQKDEFYKNRLNTLKHECDGLKSHYDYHRSILQNQVDTLKKKSEQVPRKSRSLENSPSRLTVTSLLRECGTKDKEIAALREKIVKMEKSIGETEKLATATSPKSGRKSGTLKSKETSSEIHKLQFENNNLKLKIEEQRLVIENNRISQQANVIAHESELNDRIAQLEAQLDDLRIGHEREINEVKLDYAARHSASTVAKLMTEVETQQIELQHYKCTVDDEKQAKRKLAEGLTRNKELMETIESLKLELAETRACQSPKMQHFEELRLKVHQLEMRYAEKEQAVRKIMSRSGLQSNQDELVATWKQRYYSKHQQIAHFRAELDEILEVLRELQKQGISCHR